MLISFFFSGRWACFREKNGPYKLEIRNDEQENGRVWPPNCHDYESVGQDGGGH